MRIKSDLCPSQCMLFIAQVSVNTWHAFAMNNFPQKSQVALNSKTCGSWCWNGLAKLCQALICGEFLVWAFCMCLQKILKHNVSGEAQIMIGEKHYISCGWANLTECLGENSMEKGKKVTSVVTFVPKWNFSPSNFIMTLRPCSFPQLLLFFKTILNRELSDKSGLYFVFLRNQDSERDW